jgi:iron-sulfur cluster assembly protein
MDNKPEYQVFITPIAVEQIKKQLANRGTPDGYLRLGVRGGSCNGFEYVLQFEDIPKSKDIIFNIDNIKTVVDPKSIVILNGTTLDYEKTLIKSGYIFRNNPQEDKSCGCGKSFSIKT